MKNLFSALVFLIAVSPLALAVAPTVFLPTLVSPPNGNTADIGGTLEINACWNLTPTVLNRSELWTNETGTFQKKNIQGEISGNCTKFNYPVPSLKTTIMWNITAFDNESHSNSTPNTFFITDDTSPPKFNNIRQSSDIIKPNREIIFSGDLTDNVGLSQMVFSINDTGNFVNTSYNIAGKDFSINIPWKPNPNNTGITVSWLLSANDTGGRIVKTDTQTFFILGCPRSCSGGFVPGTCTDWSACQDNLQNKICYACGEDTDYNCAVQKQTKNCTSATPSKGRQEAQDAINFVVASIEAAKTESPPRNVTASQLLIEQAKDMFAEGNWDEAKKLADEASAALRAKPLTSTTISGDNRTSIVAEEETPWLYIIVPILIVFIIAGVLIKLPTKSEKLEEKKTEEKKLENTCHVCGNPAKFVCSKCGKRACFDHARLYKGKEYCTECLKEMGLI